MASIQTLERASVKTDLRLAKILERLEVEDVSDEEVDAALDDQ